MRLEGKVAIVTGASPNIGGSVASGFAAEGAKLAVNDIKSEVAEDRANRIKSAGGEAIAIPGDVTDEALADASVQKVLDTFGKVDILVNNAVIFNGKGLLDMPIEEYRRQLDIMLAGSFLWTRAVARSMIERGVRGSIINLLSGAAWQGQPGNIGYSTAKSGLINFTRSAAMELARYGIRVNGFTPTATQAEDPGLIEQRAQAASTNPRPAAKYRNDFLGLIPLGRLPGPSDYIPAFVYLASDESSMVTGTNISVDGGAQAKYWSWIPERD